MMKWLLVAAIVWAAWKVLRPAVRAKGQHIVRDEAEARAILGVSATADADAIRTAHRRLVASVHPDRGGSPELARKVNAARDLLLKSRG